MPKANVWVSGIVAILFMAGCAGNGKKPENLTDKEKAYAAMSREELAGKGESIQNHARTLELDIYAPRKNKEINKTLDQLRAALKRNDRKSALEEIIRAERLLSEGEQTRIFVQAELRDQIAVNASLRKLQAMTVFPKDYQSLASELSELIAKVEDGKSEKISKDMQKLLTALLALEVKVIRFHALHEVEESLADAKKRGVEKFAPLTYAEAVAAFQAAEAYIAQNPHDDAGISAAARAAKFALEHAFNVADTVRDRLDKKLSAEQLVRDEEQDLLSVGKILGIADARDRMLPGQVEALRAATRQCLATSSALDQARQALDAANRELAEEKARTSTLKALSAGVETESERNAANLAKENERLRAEAASAAKLRARIDEMAAYCGPPPATE